MGISTDGTIWREKQTGKRKEKKKGKLGTNISRLGRCSNFFSIFLGLSRFSPVH
jgi:hypothetical protein